MVAAPLTGQAFIEELRARRAARATNGSSDDQTNPVNQIDPTTQVTPADPTQMTDPTPTEPQAPIVDPTPQDSAAAVLPAPAPNEPPKIVPISQLPPAPTSTPEVTPTVQPEPLPAEPVETPDPQLNQAASTPGQPTQPTNQPNPTEFRDQFDPNDPNAYYEDDMYYDEGYFPGVAKPLPEEVVFEWIAPNRPFKKRARQYYTTIGIIVALICLILFFAGQMLPIAVVISVAFLAYVLASVPPEMVRHQITTYGLRIDDQLYFWEELGRFWMGEKFGQKLFHVELGRFPFRLTVMLGDQSPDEVREILSEALLEQEPTPTTFDRAAQWLQKTLPLDIDR